MVRRYIGGRSGTQYKQHGGLIRSACNNNIANAYCVFIGCMQCWRLCGRARNALEIRRQCKESKWLDARDDPDVTGSQDSCHGINPSWWFTCHGIKKYSCYGEGSKFLTTNCDSQQNDSCHHVIITWWLTSDHARHVNHRWDHVIMGSDDDSRVIESQKDSCHGIRRWLTCHHDHSSIIMWWFTRNNYIQLI